MIKIKRIYEPHAANDGYRVLVDRLWPCGIKKETANIEKHKIITLLYGSKDEQYNQAIALKGFLP